MLPTHGVNSMSRTVAHGHTSEKICAGEKLSGRLCGCLRRYSPSSLMSYAQLSKTTSTLGGENVEIDNTTCTRVFFCVSDSRSQGRRRRLCLHAYPDTNTRSISASAPVM